MPLLNFFPLIFISKPHLLHVTPQSAPLSVSQGWVGAVFKHPKPARFSPCTAGSVRPGGLSLFRGLPCRQPCTCSSEFPPGPLLGVAPGIHTVTTRGDWVLSRLLLNASFPDLPSKLWPLCLYGYHPQLSAPNNG